MDYILESIEEDIATNVLGHIDPASPLIKNEHLSLSPPFVDELSVQSLFDGTQQTTASEMPLQEVFKKQRRDHNPPREGAAWKRSKIKDHVALPICVLADSDPENSITAKRFDSRHSSSSGHSFRPSIDSKSYSSAEQDDQVHNSRSDSPLPTFSFSLLRASNPLLAVDPAALLSALHGMILNYPADLPIADREGFKKYQTELCRYPMAFLHAWHSQGPPLREDAKAQIFNARIDCWLLALPRPQHYDKLYNQSFWDPNMEPYRGWGLVDGVWHGFGGYELMANAPEGWCNDVLFREEEKKSRGSRGMRSNSDAASEESHRLALFKSMMAARGVKVGRGFEKEMEQSDERTGGMNQSVPAPLIGSFTMHYQSQGTASHPIRGFMSPQCQDPDSTVVSVAEIEQLEEEEKWGPPPPMIIDQTPQNYIRPWAPPQAQHPSNSLPLPRNPRLRKHEVDILEKEFKKNSMPTTQVKRAFAEDMGLDLNRINNWFQSRRVRRNQEAKREKYKAGQAQEALGHPDSASRPSISMRNGYFTEEQQQQQQEQSSSLPPLIANQIPRYSFGSLPVSQGARQPPLDFETQGYNILRDYQRRLALLQQQNQMRRRMGFVPPQVPNPQIPQQLNPQQAQLRQLQQQQQMAAQMVHMQAQAKVQYAQQQVQEAVRRLQSLQQFNEQIIHANTLRRTSGMTTPGSSPVLEPTAMETHRS